MTINYTKTLIINWFIINVQYKTLIHACILTLPTILTMINEKKCQQEIYVQFV